MCGGLPRALSRGAVYRMACLTALKGRRRVGTAAAVAEYYTVCGCVSGAPWPPLVL